MDKRVLRRDLFNKLFQRFATVFGKLRKLSLRSRSLSHCLLNPKKKKKKFWKRDQRIINYDRKKNMLSKKLIGAKKTFQKVTAGSGRPQGGETGKLYSFN